MGWDEVPRYLSRFVDREDERQALRARLERFRIVTIVGLGGSGKTRLASEIAHDSGWLDDRLAYYIDIKRLTSVDDVTGPIEAIDHGSDLDGREPADTGGGILLIIDNCDRGPPDTGETIIRLITARPEIRVLALARRPLGIAGEALVRLEGLAIEGDDASGEPGPAVCLLLDRLAATDPPFDPSRSHDALRTLCGRVAGSPLGIELLAAQLATIDPVGLDNLLDDPGNAARLLGTDGADHPGGLSQIIVHTVSTLEPTARDAFDALRRFENGFTIDAAATLTGLDESELLLALGCLRQSSLAVPDPRIRARWSIPQSVLDLAPPLQADLELDRRWFSAVIELVESHRASFWSIDEPAAMNALAAEHRNIDAALHFALEHGDGVGLLRLTSTMARPWDVLGQAEYGQDWLERSLESGADATDDLRARSWLGLGVLAMLRGRHDTATAALETASRLAGLSDDRLTAAQAAHFRAVAALYSSDPDAEDLLLAARDLALDDDLPLIAAWSELFVAASRLTAGDIDEASVLASAAASRLRSYSDQESLGWVDFIESIIARVRGRDDVSVRHLERSIDSFAALGSGWGLLATGLVTAELLLTAGDPDRAFSIVEHGETVRGRGGAIHLPDTERWADSIRARCRRDGAGPGSGDQGRTVDPAQFATELRQALAGVPRNTGTGSDEVRRRVATLQRQGEAWLVAYADRSRMLRPTNGLTFLRTLIEQGGAGVHAITLSEQVSDGASDRTTPLDRSDAGPRLDRRAIHEYRERLRDLQLDIEEADSWNDSERASALRREQEFITDEIASGLGLGGRLRRDGSEAERARQRVTKAIRSAIDRISRFDAELGRHLSDSVHTGTECSYRPDPTADVVWVDRP